MLEWNVYVENFNAKKIEVHNVFNHCGLLEDLAKDMKKVHVREDRPEEKKWFFERLKRNIQYYYWSKCEWEIILTSWPPDIKDFKDMKVDVYDQIMLNWDIFCEYVWKNRRELKRNRKTES